jgi:hypothetical protein
MGWLFGEVKQGMHWVDKLGKRWYLEVKTIKG